MLLFVAMLCACFFFAESDCILHGYIKKLGGPWTSSWQMRYAKLYPNRLELHPDSAKPEMIFMDQVEEVSPELVQVKNEQCIIIRMRDGKIVLTNPVSDFLLFSWPISTFYQFFKLFKSAAVAKKL